MKSTLKIMLLMCIPFFGKGQITVNFMPEIQGRTLESIMGARFMNSGQKQACRLEVRITAGDGSLVAETTTPAFELSSGMNMLPAPAVYRSAWKFGSGKTAAIVKQTHQFPEGEYEYCFTLSQIQGSHIGELLAEQCFSHLMQPFSPLELTEPYDNDRICDKRPILVWQPLLPAMAGMTYRLLLVEVKENQAVAEALHYNMPLIRQHAIPSPMLLYPPLSRELVQGRKYAWQVTAVREETILARSEIWSFTVQCDDSIPKSPVRSFRNIEDLTKGNFYIAEESILFSVENTYAKADLVYSIRSITAPGTKIGKLPAAVLVTGRNEVEIDLSEVRGMVDGHYYILHITLPNGTTRTLRFLYKHATE